jgi:hypothetical protein
MFIYEFNQKLKLAYNVNVMIGKKLRSNVLINRDERPVQGFPSFIFVLSFLSFTFPRIWVYGVKGNYVGGEVDLLSC